MSRKWYSCYKVRCEVLPEKWKKKFKHLVQETWPRMCGPMVLNSKKASEVWKSWDLSRSHDIIRGGYGKKLRRFQTIYHVWCLQTEVSQKKNRIVEKDSVRFDVKATIELGIDYKTFCIFNREHRLIHVYFWYFFGSVW